MSQSKKMSFLEAIVSTFVGMGITFAVSPFAYWLCGVPIRWSQIGGLTVIFTFISIVRGYVIRRAFEFIEKWKQHKKTQKQIQ